MSKRKTFEEFFNLAKEKYDGKYDYDKATYKDTHTKMRIICPEHGEFWQTPKAHLMYECEKCSYEKRGKQFRKTTEDFIKRAREVHGDRYDYSKVFYETAKTPVCIICSKHGEFLQKPNDHLNGKGCPKCRMSHLENEVLQFLEKNKIEFIYQYTDNKLKRQSLDFYLPKYNIGIECQGKQHFGLGGWGNDVKEIFELDEQKYKICTQFGMILYYIIPNDIVPDNNTIYKDNFIKIKDINKLLQWLI